LHLACHEKALEKGLEHFIDALKGCINSFSIHATTSTSACYLAQNQKLLYVLVINI